MMIIRKIGGALALALLSTCVSVSSASAQCGPVFQAGRICGNPAASDAAPAIVTLSSIMSRALPSITDASASLTYTNSLWDFRVRNASATNLGGLLDMQLGKSGTPWVVPGAFTAVQTIISQVNVGAAGASGQIGGLNIDVTTVAGTDGTTYGINASARCQDAWTAPSGLGGCIGGQFSTVMSKVGDAFAVYGRAECNTSACRSISGGEVDVVDLFGALQRDGLSIVDAGSTVVPPTNASGLLIVAANPTFAWNYGIEIGRGAGSWPTKNSGGAGIIFRNGTVDYGIRFDTMTIGVAAIQLETGQKISFDATRSIISASGLLNLINAGGTTSVKVGDDTLLPDLRIAGGGSASQGAQLLFLKASAHIHQIGHQSGILGGGSTSNNLTLYAASGDAITLYTHAGTLAATFDTSGNALFNTVSASGALNVVASISMTGASASFQIYDRTLGQSHAFSQFVDSNTWQMFSTGAAAIIATLTEAGNFTAIGTIRANTAFNVNGTAGATVTASVRDSGGAGDCNLVFAGGILTSTTC